MYLCWTSDSRKFLTTAPLTTVTVYWPEWGPGASRSSTTKVVPAEFKFKASDPCCAKCSVKGHEVQVFYWPTPALTPALSTLVDTSASFTL